MRLIKTAIISTNPTVGAFRSNPKKLRDWAQKASEERVALAVTGEAAIGGYSPEDLLDWRGFTEGQWDQLQEFAYFTGVLSFPTIFVVGLFLNHGGENFNAAAVVCGGEIFGGHFKENLPTYNVFRESRKCTRGEEGLIVDIDGSPFGDVMFEAPFGKFSVSLCEDVWNPYGPLMRRAYSGSELDCVPNASPFRVGVVRTRYEMQATRSADNVVGLLSSYIVGANDGLIMDGGGYAFSNGRLQNKAPRWKEGMTVSVFDLDSIATARAANTTWRTARSDYFRKSKPTHIVKVSGSDADYKGVIEQPVPASKNFFVPMQTEPVVDPLTELFEDLEQAIVLGTVDYYRKTGAFKVMGNPGSGGTDSAITSIIEWIALRRILADQGLSEAEIKARLATDLTIFSMPSEYNSEATKSLIRSLAEDLGVGFVEEPIQEAYEREVEALKRMLPPGTEIPDLTLQNIQVRIRFTRMWNWANATGGFFP